MSSQNWIKHLDGGIGGTLKAASTSIELLLAEKEKLSQRMTTIDREIRDILSEAENSIYEQWSEREISSAKTKATSGQQGSVIPLQTEELIDLVKEQHRLILATISGKPFRCADEVILRAKKIISSLP